MIDPRINKLARVLVHYSSGVKAGERVQLMGTPASEPLLRELYREVLRVGAHPIVRMRLSDQDALLFAEATEQELDYTDPMVLSELDGIDFNAGAKDRSGGSAQPIQPQPLPRKLECPSRNTPNLSSAQDG